MLQSTVAFFIFNRPEVTRCVFERIAAARPQRLLVVADGPRLNRKGESDRCDEARKIIDAVDWRCEVLLNYSDVNLGCRQRLSTGLDWVFQVASEAIILEDDCLPDPTFFPYVQELLDRFRHDTRVMAITGSCFHPRHLVGTDSYYFSRFFHCWGWGTWRRAWNHYDESLTAWTGDDTPDWLAEALDNDPTAIRYWHGIFDSVKAQQIDTWDYQFSYACLSQHGLCAMPAKNLISNLGFHTDATHTKEVENHLANLPTESLKWPLRHAPPISSRCVDRWSMANLFADPRPSFFQRACHILTKIFKS